MNRWEVWTGHCRRIAGDLRSIMQNIWPTVAAPQSLDEPCPCWPPCRPSWKQSRLWMIALGAGYCVSVVHIGLTWNWEVYIQVCQMLAVMQKLDVFKSNSVWFTVASLRDVSDRTHLLVYQHWDGVFDAKAVNGEIDGRYIFLQMPCIVNIHLYMSMHVGLSGPV